MKISDLIKKLEEQKEHSGDLEVFINGSNRVYLNPLPWYYDGGGDTTEDGKKWYSTRFSGKFDGQTILHLDSIVFDYGSDYDEYYDGVYFPEIALENFEEKYEEARARYRKECRKL